MASLENLPPDRRAVLALVLQRGRSYDQIASMLSIDRAAVRERALAGLDALGPATGVPAERRALITDYLLGQLPAGIREETRTRLAGSAAERAWARVVASELAPLSSGPLSEIPAEAPRAEAEPAREPQPGPDAEAEARPEAEPFAAAAATGDPTEAADPSPRRRSSRTGGVILLAVLALVVVAAVVVAVVLLAGGSSSSSSTHAPAPPATTPATSTTATSTTSTSAATSRPIAQVNLVSPNGSKKIGGVAVVVQQGNAQGLVIRAQGVPANSSRDAYAVWLYNSPTDNHILGFVNPGVKANGVLQTAGGLPANAAHYKQLLVTLESQAKPATPGKIVLKGPLSL